MYQYNFEENNRRNKVKFHAKSVGANLKFTSVNVADVKLWNNSDKEIKSGV